MDPNQGANRMASAPAISILVPASNEADLIEACLKAVLASEWPVPEPPEVIVISNGSSDATSRIAVGLRAAFAGRGWVLHVLERTEGDKLAALNAGDRIARSANRIYLDADVMASPELLHQLYTALDASEPRYASGSIVLKRAESAVTRAYARIYRRVPFMSHGVPGAGIFAVNAAGRMRWDRFPDIISDDTFVRLSFSPQERIGVSATYEWPLVEGWRNLVKVRRRQNLGVDEIRTRFPHLLRNDDKPKFRFGDKIKLAAKDPVGFVIYSAVSLAVRLTPSKPSGWDRGR